VNRAVAGIALAFAGLFLLNASTASAQDALEKIRQRGSLVWGADQEGGGPFIYPAADDPTRLEGFEVEIAEYLAGKLGVKSQFQQGQWDKLPDLMDRGDIDIVLNGYEWTPNRATRYGTSIPYYIYELQLLARKDDESLRAWDDLANPSDGELKRVSVLGGSAAQSYLESRYPDQVAIANFDGAADAMRAVELQLDGIDANLQDLPVWTFYQNGFPDLVPIGLPVGRGYYVILTRSNETALLQQLNRAIIDGMLDGSLRRIYEKYRMWNLTQSERGLDVDGKGNFSGDRIARAAGESGPDEQDFQAVRGWSVVMQRGGLLVWAAGLTIVLAVISMPLAILIGLVLALCRMFGNGLLKFLASLYIEVVRGTPLVLQLYVIFFLLPEIGISIHAFWAAVIGLAVNYSAYEAEIYRAGIQAIPRGQMEAATALGMSRGLTLRRIVIPQATRLVIPPMTNDFIALFKDTAVCSVITVVELSKQYYIHARSTGAILELGIVTALLYMAMSYPLSLVASHLEKRLARERRK